MSKTIAVTIQKGGTGKTTTVHALTGVAHAAGQKVLAIDLDPQGNLTQAFGINATTGSYDLFKGAAAADLIVKTPYADVIPYSETLSQADIDLSRIPGQARDTLLLKALEPIKGNYDLILIDTAPALNTLLINTLAAADGVLIPVQADIFSLQSLYQLLDTVGQVKQYVNSELDVMGVFITRYNARSTLSRDMKTALQLKCNENKIPLLDTVIREGIAVKEAAIMQQPITDYAPKSNPAKDYTALANELKLI